VQEYISKEHRKAFTLMAEARSLLFSALHRSTNERQSLAEGLDRLGVAFEYLEKPLGDVPLCPACGCFCVEEQTDGTAACLSCDHLWQKETGECHADH